MGLSCGRAGRLTAENGVGLRSAQFGQAPNPHKVQALVYQQLTGRTLPPEDADESKRQTLMAAMHGKRILLVLDPPPPPWRVGRPGPLLGGQARCTVE
jgi:hypothetical protein